MPAYKDKETGKWFASFYYKDYEGNTKYKRKRGFDLKREALEYEREFLEHQQVSPDMLLSSFLEIYKKDRYPQLRKHTIQAKEYKHKRILPYFEDIPLNQIAPKDIMDWQNEMLEYDFSTRYIKNLQSELSAIFNHAVNYYDLKENPCSKVKAVKNPDEMPQEMRFWTLEEYLNVIDKVSDIKSRTAINLLYWTGMRKGELYALTWGDIDLNNNTVTINKSFQRLQGEDVVTPTKTYENRTLKLASNTMNQLGIYKKTCYETKPKDKIFIWEKTFLEDGIAQGTKSANEEIEEYNKENEKKLPYIERIHVHGLRHSHASYLISRGVNIVLVSKRLGHKNTSMTLDTYSHFYPTDEISLIDIIEKDTKTGY